MYHHIADVVDGNTLFVPADEFKMEMTHQECWVLYFEP
jgi:hypothetical protein